MPPRYHSALGDFATAEAERFYIEALRRMTPEQRCQVALDLWDMAVEVSRAGVRATHPEWSETQVRAEVARRIMEANGAARSLRSGAGGP